MGIFSRTRRQIPRRRGSATLEVIFAILIISTAAMMFSALIPPAIKTERMMSSHQQATSLIQHKIDQLRGVGWGRLTYNELRDAEIIDTTATSSPFRWDAADNLTTYYKAATGTIAVSDFDANIKRVTVTLTWTGAAARQGNGTLSVVTLIAK
jgi:type II secretory pathway pseudopilin PulG